MNNLTPAQALDELKRTKEIKTNMLSGLGLSFDAFLAYAQANNDNRQKFIARLIEVRSPKETIESSWIYGAELKQLKAEVVKRHARTVTSWNRLQTFESSTMQRAKEHQYLADKEQEEQAVRNLIYFAKLAQARKIYRNSQNQL